MMNTDNDTSVILQLVYDYTQSRSGMLYISYIYSLTCKIMNRIACKNMASLTDHFHDVSLDPIITKEIVWDNAKPYVTLWRRLRVVWKDVSTYTHDGRKYVTFNELYRLCPILAIRSNKDVDSLRFHNPSHLPMLGTGCPVVLRAGETLSCEPPYFGRFMCNTDFCTGFILQEEYAKAIADGDLIIEILIASNYTMLELRRIRYIMLKDIRRRAVKFFNSRKLIPP